MGIQQSADQEARRHHIVVPNGQFTVYAFTTNAVEREARNQIAAELVDIGAGANAKSDIDATPVEGRRLDDRHNRVGGMSNRSERQDGNCPKKKRFC